MLRWGIPAGIAAVAIAVPASGAVLNAAPSPSLPPMTAQQLLAAIQTAKVNGLSGTVVQTSDLGLPQLPGLTGTGAPNGGSSSLSSMVSGSHTLRVWYAGPDKARIALLGQLGESDVIMNNKDLWVWSSADHSATHTTLQLPKRTAGTPSPGKDHPLANATPQEIAAELLKAIGPTTSVTTTGSSTVAGRPAYELLIQPKDTRSLVGQVRVAIDGATKLPLQVEVFAAGAGTPAVKVGFSQVNFSAPSADNFTFTPPPGTKVTQQDKSGPAKLPDPRKKAQSLPADQRPTVVGKGWTSVVVAKLPADALKGQPTQEKGQQSVQGILGSLPKVSGSWGSGRLLSSSLFSALITDDGRVLVGAVKPELLYAAAAQK
jgi:outer membrane lipoprotein-sorting protein